MSWYQMLNDILNIQRVKNVYSWLFLSWKFRPIVLPMYIILMLLWMGYQKWENKKNKIQVRQRTRLVWVCTAQHCPKRWSNHLNLTILFSTGVKMNPSKKHRYIYIYWNEITQQYIYSDGVRAHYKAIDVESIYKSIPNSSTYPTKYIGTC